MKRVKSSFSLLVLLAVLAGVTVSLAEEGTTTITTDTGVTLTPVPEEIINQVAYGILINSMDKENVIMETDSGARIVGSIGDKLKDLYLIPIYDINGIVAQYYALGYAGDGKMKNLDELFSSLWISFDVWKKYQQYLQEVEFSLQKTKELNLSPMDSRNEINNIKTIYKDVIDIAQHYELIGFFNRYFHVGIGSFYEIPPQQSGGEGGIPEFVGGYWNCYYTIKDRYNTDNISFIRCVFDNDCKIMYMFEVDDKYIYASSIVNHDTNIADIYSQNEFEGLDINKINVDCPLLKYTQNRKKLWDSAIENYRKSQEEQNLNGCWN